jgi:hypothetical protein
VCGAFELDQSSGVLPSTPVPKLSNFMAKCHQALELLKDEAVQKVNNKVGHVGARGHLARRGCRRLHCAVALAAVQLRADRLAAVVLGFAQDEVADFLADNKLDAFLKGFQACGCTTLQGMQEYVADERVGLKKLQQNKVNRALQAALA